MKKERLHTASLIIGSILALAITFSQYLTPECVAGDNKVKTEQTDTSGEESDAAYISLPTFSIPAPVSVQGSLDPYFLFEILFEADVDENHVEDEESYVDRFFQTMFRVIISPNAP
jgi:hypothetical protein